MSIETHRSKDSRVTVEDFFLAVLGLVAGPLLWWIGNSWQHAAAASSMQTLEYWIGLICGFLGLALCVLWCLFALASITLIIGLKTRHRVITYWAELVTPRFIRRIIVAVFGAQLALGAQAFAAPIDQSPQPLASETAVPEDSEPFMPYVVTDPSGLATLSDEAAAETEAPTSFPSSSNDPSPTTQVDIPAEPRQHSQVTVTPEVSATPSSTTAVPTPRETTTITIEPNPVTPPDESAPGNTRQTTPYLPVQPSPSPHIAEPNEARTIEDPTVVVRQGDCLWDIAHHELGADASLVQIDQRWRQWWEYNRHAIGDDPHQLNPGTILISPPFQS